MRTRECKQSPQSTCTRVLCISTVSTLPGGRSELRKNRWKTKKVKGIVPRYHLNSLCLSIRLPWCFVWCSTFYTKGERKRIDVLPALKGEDSLAWRSTSATEHDVDSRVDIPIMQDTARGTTPGSDAELTQSTRPGACATGRASLARQVFWPWHTDTSKPIGFICQLVPDRVPGRIVG